MPTSLPVHPETGESERGKLTGRKVFLILCAFFGVIFAMNALFLHLAFSTFGGIETAGAYRRNFLLTSEIAAAERQDALGWRVEGSVERRPDNTAAVTVVARDRDGAPLKIRSLEAELRRPASNRFDQKVTLKPVTGNRFEGQAIGVMPGNWLLVLTLFDGKGERFHSKNRLILK